MKQTRILMDMPITVEVIDGENISKYIDEVYLYFEYIDNKFSTFKEKSEISLFNKGKINSKNLSHDMKTILRLSEETKKVTNGYFDIQMAGKLDPSGIVKGWAIKNAAYILKEKGIKNYYIEAGGDIQVSGQNSQGQFWKIGIRNPFNINEIVKIVYIKDMGVATSGTYFRGMHIYNPKDKNKLLEDIVSLTVIGPNIYEADRFATACFAMGKNGINFLENLNGFEGYMIDKNGIATFTSGFNKYTYEAN